MAFVQTELAFEPGLFGNRSKRASKNRWVDGNLVRFDDGVPAQIGGWKRSRVSGARIVGRARDILAWRPNNQASRLAVIGTNSNAYQFDGGSVVDITPADFVAGRADSIVGAGFGAGHFGADAFGTARTQTSNVLEAGGWTFDMFGEVLIGCGVGDGTLYDYLAGTDARLKPIAGAPKGRAMCVSDERHVFVFGCDGNPNLVRWSDRENRGLWVPRSTNRAGSYEMQATSAFQCGRRVRGSIGAWTQTEVFAFTPLSNSLVYSYDRLASNCGTMGPHAVEVVTASEGDVAYWMAPHSFYVFDGTVRRLDCELADYVFKDINLLQRAKVQARANTLFGEIWFFYCSATSNEIDRAVIYSYKTGVWSKAGISRLAWLDAGIFPLPIAIDEAGTIFEHETGDTADGEPIPSFVLSYPLSVGAGQQMSDVAAFWPDMDPMSGTTSLTVVGRDYPGGPDMLFGPYPFDPTTEKVDLAISARQIQLMISGVSGYWELGIPLIEVQAGGGR